MQQPGEKKPHYPFVGNNNVENLNFLLGANRNILISLIACFGAGIFAATGDALDYRNRPGVNVPGTLSITVAVIAILLILVVACVHSWMVYKHATYIRKITLCWFILPVAAVVAVWVPMIMYVIVLKT